MLRCHAIVRREHGAALTYLVIKACKYIVCIAHCPHISTDVYKRQVADEEVSMQGKILANLMGHITNDLAIGKKINSGELRQRMKEHAWLVPECFVTEDIDMGGFTMKLLS